MTRARDLADLGGSANAGTVTGESLIINGDMTVAQRGTSSTSTGYQTVDRFKVDKANTDQLVFTQSQSTTVPSGQGFSNSLKIEVTTAETTLDSDEYFSFQQKIEAQNLQHLNYGNSSAKTLTLSFWVRSSLTGKYSINAYSQDGNRVNILSFNINTADTWEYKTVTFDGDTAGTINNDNGQGLNFNFVLAAGSSFSSTITSGWQVYTNDKYAHSDQENFIAQTGTFYITGLKLEVGSTATPFQHESYGDNLAKCHRYCYRVPVEDNLEAHPLWIYTTNASSTRIPLGVTMRSAPTITIEGSTNSATDWDIYYNASFRTLNSIVAANVTSGSFRVNATAGGLTSGGAAGLYSRSADAGLIADAEL